MNKLFSSAVSLNGIDTTLSGAVISLLSLLSFVVLRKQISNKKILC